MISTHLTFLQETSQEVVRSFVEITVENSDVRVPTHFVLLLDTSGSMEEKNKLENVKKCVEFLLHILTPQDKISVITFSDDSKIILQNVPADAVHKNTIESKVRSIHPDGSTNMSASIVNLKKVIKEERMKTGVILLTDGHANIGVHDCPTLQTMFRTVREQNPLLTIACLAYGTDHNADLLKGISADGGGSYAIVSCLEDAATAIGDIFGSFISCAAQNVEAQFPSGTTVEGPSELKNSTLRIGDLYSGSSLQYIVNLPGSAIQENKPLLTLTGTKVPSLDSLTISCSSGTVHLERHRNVELTSLRYTCANLFKQLKDWETLNSVARANLQEAIHRFSDTVQDTFFDGHAIGEMLRSEATSLNNSVKLLVERRVEPRALRTHIVQHESVMTSGRGYTQTIDDESDPVELRSAAPTAVPTPFRNRTQNMVASVMRTMSTR
jgi:Mg-chelatase subunit ChlD